MSKSFEPRIIGTTDSVNVKVGIKDGFKLGIGFLLAQLVLGVIVFALSLSGLYLIGSSVKDKAVSVLLNTPSITGEEK